jgi:hypothetical protein
MRDLMGAVVLALLLGVLVAISAYLTAPERQFPPPTPIPLAGGVPAGLTNPIEPEFVPICGADICVTR